MALVRFKDEKSAQAFTTAASKAELYMLDSEKIARMLLSSLTPLNTTLGYDNTTTEMAKKLLQEHGEQLITHTLTSQERFTEICNEMGVGPVSPDLDAKKQVTELKEKILSGATEVSVEEPKKDAESAPATEGIYQVCYLPNTNKVLLTSGNQAKVFSADETQRAIKNIGEFANFPTHQQAAVNLHIGRTDLDFVLEKLPWGTLNQKVSMQFLEAVTKSYDTQSCSIEIAYFSALQAVQVMLAAAIQLY